MTAVDAWWCVEQFKYFQISPKDPRPGNDWVRYKFTQPCFLINQGLLFGTSWLLLLIHCSWRRGNYLVSSYLHFGLYVSSLYTFGKDPYKYFSFSPPADHWMDSLSVVALQLLAQFCAEVSLTVELVPNVLYFNVMRTSTRDFLTWRRMYLSSETRSNLTIGSLNGSTSLLIYWLRVHLSVKAVTIPGLYRPT